MKKYIYCYPSPDSLVIFGPDIVYEGSEIELKCQGGPSIPGKLCSDIYN